MQPRILALFDLDHTLLPLDSDVMWAQHLVEVGAVEPTWHQRRNDHFFEQYKQGTLNIDEFLAFQLAPLAAHPRAQLEAWREAFFRSRIEPQITPEARALVDQHREAGHLTAIVTATNEFITAPIARAFGVEHLIATLVQEEGGAFTGRSYGVPSFREGKVTRVAQWLALMGHDLEGFEESHFYSDSLNDLPLLSRVSHPVAVNPDQTLKQHAQDQGWPVIHLFSEKSAT